MHFLLGALRVKMLGIRQVQLYKDHFLFSFPGKMKHKPKLIGPHPQNETVILGGVASFQCKVKSVVWPHIQVGTHPQTETVILGGVASFQCKVKSVVWPHIQVTNIETEPKYHMGLDERNPDLVACELQSDQRLWYSLSESKATMSDYSYSPFEGRGGWLQHDKSSG